MSIKTEASFLGGFTVLMALYGGDRNDLFIRAVHSVFSNTLLPNQFLIIVDGPIPDSLSASVRMLKEHYPLIEFVYLSENKGLANALNVGLRLVKFAWVLRADADDVNLPERFMTLATICAENPQVQLIGSAILEVDETGRQLVKRIPPKTMDKIRIFARKRNPFNHMTVAFRLDAIQELGGYPSIYLKEDYGLWCKCLAANISMANTDEVLVWATTGMPMYRRRGGWRYVQSEYALQKLMLNLGLKNFIQALYDGILRSIFFLIPARLRGVIYLGALRERLSARKY